MLTPNGRPFSQLNQANDLRDDDFIPLLRPSEPLPDDQNVIISGARAKAILGDNSGGTPGPALTLYGTPGTHTDGPMHQLAATEYANRGPNTSPATPVHIVRVAHDTDRPAGSTVDTLDTLVARGIVGLGHRAWVLEPVLREKVVLYKPGGFDCFRDGRNQDTSEGEWVDAEAVRDLVFWALIDPATFKWRTNWYTSIYLGSPVTERLFRYAGPDNAVAAAPTGVPATDAGVWVEVAREDIPPVATYDDTAVRNLIDDLDGRTDDLEADVVFVEQEVTDLQNESTQTRGWIGSMSSLLTSAKGSLVAAINDLLSKMPKLYGATGQQTDGALTVKAATDAFALKTTAQDVREILSDYTLAKLYDEIVDPPQTYAPSSPRNLPLGFAALNNQGFLFTQGGTANLYQPLLSYDGLGLTIRLAENATSNLTVHAVGGGVGRDFVVVPGEIICLTLVPPNLKTYNSSGELAVWKLLFRSVTATPAFSPAAFVAAYDQAGSDFTASVVNGLLRLTLKTTSPAVGYPATYAATY